MKPKINYSQISKDKINQGKFPWFIIYTNQTSYLMQKLYFENFFRMNFSTEFELIPIKIEYSGLKDFRVKLKGFLELIKIAKKRKIKEFIFTDLDTFIFCPSKKLKNIVLNHKNIFMKGIGEKHLVGWFFKISLDEFIKLEKDFINKLNDNTPFGNYEEVLFYQKYKNNYIDFQKFFDVEVYKTFEKNKRQEIIDKIKFNLKDIKFLSFFNCSNCFTILTCKKDFK